MKIFTITLLVIFLFVLLLFIDFQLGQKRHNAKVKKMTFPKRSGHLHLFTSGPILLETLFADISHAKHHVHVQFYILKNDTISKQFLALLKKKSEEGVEVRLLLDRIGSFQFKKNKIEKLKASGVKFSFSQSPKFPFLFYLTPYLIPLRFPIMTMHFGKKSSKFYSNITIHLVIISHNQ